MRISVILAVLIIASVSVWAVPVTDTQNGVFHPSFGALQVTVNDNPMSTPVIALDSPDRIVISFDERAEDRRYMRYELIHCDAMWKPDGLVASEYIDGFNEGTVEQYEFSQMTLTHYVHYRIVVPDGQMRITVSGNYLLRVYPEDDPDDILLQARFCVSEASAKVGVGVTSITDAGVNDKWQQLELVIDTEQVDGIEDLFSDLTVVVEQNGRDDNKAVVRHPLRVSGKRAIYEHLRQLIFPAGNEYRRFETVSTQYPGMGVERIVYNDPFYNFMLYTDVMRADGPYVYDETQHGRFFVSEYNSSESDTEADYVGVHFALDIPEIGDADVYLDGDLVNRRFGPESRMVFNRATGRYEKSLLLKQGAYNYQYVTLPRGSSVGGASRIEGDFHNTRNEYTVKVYHRPRGSRYDRLIGVAGIVFGDMAGQRGTLF